MPSWSSLVILTRPLAEARWPMRVLVTVPVVLEVSLSLSLRRRFLLMAIPDELRLLEAAAAAEEWCARPVWAWPDPEERATAVLAEGGLGDNFSLKTVEHERET